ncbi:MAG: regulatory protein RecX [Lachnospiraceae bacterium]|nr:regulatory protein RecX [Lachnospiraceae bacterium]
MMITELKEVSSSRVKVYVDEQPAFVLYKGELRKYGLKEGEELSPKIYEELLREVLPKRAKLRLMNLLKSRDYTELQLRQKLRQGFYPETVIDEALSYVASFHYIDDLRYAEDFVNCNSSRKSKRRIENDLINKGISKETIQKAWINWEAAGNAQDEDEQIKELLSKKHFDASTAEPKELRKMYAFLLRRGFSSDKVQKYLQK